MFTQTKKGWFWHIKIYDYLNGVNKCFNSKEPFATYEEALRDLADFINKECAKWTKS